METKRLMNATWKSPAEARKGTSDTRQIGVVSNYLTSARLGVRTFAIHAHSIRGPLNKKPFVIKRYAEQ